MLPPSLTLIALSALFVSLVATAPGCGTSGAMRPGFGTGGVLAGSGGAPTASGGAGGFGKSAVSGLPTPPGAGGVPRPAGAPGALTILDWAGFKAAVSYTFDDTNSSQIAHYADLNGLGVPLTFYLITGKATEIASPVWPQALRDGHELGNHTMSHLQAGTAADVDAGDAFLRQTFGIIPYTMAAPYGDASYVDIARTRYLINRGVSNGVVAANDGTDPFNLDCYVPPMDSLASAFNAQIDGARAAGGWRVVLVHGFEGGSDGAYQPVSITEFVAGVGHTKSFGDVWIDTVTSIGAYWRGQKTVSSVTPVTAGDTTTWTWTLPDHFPPGKYLRATVTGGRPAQNGTPLPWNDRGYYEIALDAASLTLSP